jgi:DNA-binding response OmpR family regulator
MAKILIVEDEVDLAKLVRIALEREHHLVEIADNGADALTHLQVNKFDVVILDLMLPNLSGMEVCKRYRQAKGKTPILMLTAKTDVNDKAAGLDAGADDYLTKPFDLKELSARVRALIRRSPNLSNNVFTLRDIEVDINEFRVTKGGEEVHLLPKEFRLLEFLIRHPHHVFSAEELLASVWESDTAALLDTVRGHIKRLRKKLDTPGEPSIISTVYGIGYRIESG